MRLTIIGAGAIGRTIGAHQLSAPRGADMALLAAARLIEDALAFERHEPA